MRKVCFVSVVALLLCGTAFAQQDFIAPDYDNIKKVANDKKSPLNYDKLAKRFAKGDTTLWLEELQAFYYGFAFRPNYSPYHDYKQFDTIQSIMRRDTMPSKGTLDKIVALADEVIEECPSEPMAYFYKYAGASMLADDYGGDTLTPKLARLQFNMLCYAIASSGNGLDPMSAMHVVKVSHEYMMMDMFGFHPQSQSLSFLDGHSFDIMELDSNEYDVDTLYFNIDCLINSWSKLFSEEEDEVPPEPGLSDGRLGTQIAIEPGSRVELELVKAKRKNSKFRVAMVTYLPEDTLSSMADTANLSMDVPEGRIVFYLFNVRDAEDSGKVRTCLMYSSNCKADMLYLDTKAHIVGACIMDFQPEENPGMAKGVWKTMMWEYGVDVLVSNIRTKK